MSKTVVYIYAMTNDSGFAPCVQGNWLTLACCKGGIRGGMRKSAASEFFAGNNVYLLGLCGKTLSRETAFSPIYFAKVDEVIAMEDYYADGGRSAGRKDDVYKVVNGELHSKPNNPHKTKDLHDKDRGGSYVLCSHQFTYWGNKRGESGHEIEQRLYEVFAGIRNRQSFRGHLACRNLNSFEEAVASWDWFPKQSDKCNIISRRSIRGDSVAGGKCR